MERGERGPGAAPEGSGRRWLPLLWFAALAVVVAGPLLGSGFLLLLDYPAGPRFPSYSWLPVPSSGDPGNGAPFLALLRLLREVHAYLPDKVFLIAPILLGGVGAYRFAARRLRCSAPAAVFAGTLYAVNPFVADRYLAGHVYFLLGYALLPWALVPLAEAIARPSGRAGIPVAIWLLALGVVDLHVMAIYALLTLIAAVAATGRAMARVRFGGTALAGAALLSAFWVLPALIVRPAFGIGAADLEAYASRPRGYGVIPSLLSMHGFWRTEFTPVAEREPALFLLLIPIFGLVLAGLWWVLGRTLSRRLGLFLAVAAAASLVLAAGVSLPPTAALATWAVAHVPGAGLFREPQKHLVVVVLAYSVFGAAGLGVILERIRRRALAAGIVVVAIAGVLVYGSGLLWGLGGRVELSRYPEDWTAAAGAMEPEGRVLVLPWTLYGLWGSADGRIVANPAPSFFGRDLLVADEAGLPGVPPQSTDPFARYVTAMLEQRDATRRMGRLLAPLGVRYVAVLPDQAVRRFGFLGRQQDLVPVFEGEGATVYENAAWTGRPLELVPGPPLAALSSLVGREDEAVSTLRPAPAPVPAVAASFPPVARSLPGWDRVEPVSAPHVAVPVRCTDGWRLGDLGPACHLGAVAAFPSPGRDEVLWRPTAGATLAGWLITGLTLSSLLFYRYRLSP